MQQEWSYGSSSLSLLVKNNTEVFNEQADPSGSVVYGESLRPIACWNCGFESHRGHECLSVVSVVCCQVEPSSRGFLPTVACLA